MELRSRRRIGKTFIDANEQRISDFSEDEDSNVHGAGSDDELYTVSSDSYDNSSNGESEMDEEIGILGKNLKVKAKLGIDTNDLASISARSSSVSDHAESSTRRSMRGNEPDNEQLGQPPQAAEIMRLKGKKCYSSKRKKDSNRPLLMWEIWEEEYERWIDEHLTEDIDMDNQEEIMTETTEAPAELIIPLLRYQKEWLAWALKQEESTTKGGILADEMGMGKTIQAIALVLAKREILREACKSIGTDLLPDLSINLSSIQPTLVVCPVVAVSQWVSEIDRFTAKGSTKVLVYHGANRERNSKKFSGYDFVITTYSTVEAEFRKYMMPPKKKCEYCGKSFYENKLFIHLKYFCGPNAVRTAKQSKQQRKKLKTVPLKPVQKTVSGKDRSDGFQADIEAMQKPEFEQALCKEKSILHSVNWGRIILDEAHYVKDRRCNTAKAVFALESSYKWALSGTPLQNRVGELYSLVRFLQIVPYSYYLCKDCDCRTLDYRSSAQCSSCPHSSVRHFCWWNKYISNPIQAHGTLDLGMRAMILLKDKVLKNIVLRRTKKGRAADLALPPSIVMLRHDTLDIKEEDYYQSLYNESQAQFNTYVSSGTVMNNYAHIFDLLTRLRQAVDHPYLVVYSKTAVQKGEHLVDSHKVEQVCGICHDPAEDAAAAGWEWDSGHRKEGPLPFPVSSS